MADVRCLIAAARRVYDQRARWIAAIATSTGLSPEGVEVGFSCLERDVSDADVRALVALAGSAESIHVVLSSNVFVAPLRALAMARAAAGRVTIRPSSHDPTLTHALVEAARDPSIKIVGERDVAMADASEIHVYGRDETLVAVRARMRAGATLRGHGAGMGVVVLTCAADVLAAAAAIAADIVPFDQRGCLSPRIVIVEGGIARADAVSHALHEELVAWSTRVPRGTLFDDERADARRWTDALSFAGTSWRSEHHVVGLAPNAAPLALAPTGRHVLVAAAATLEAAAIRLAPFTPFVVAVGTDDTERIRTIAPRYARISRLGRMQRPPLDGPVDLRPRA